MARLGKGALANLFFGNEEPAAGRLGFVLRLVRHQRGVALLALGALAGNAALGAASAALDADNPARAVRDARWAKRLVPWSADPWRLHGEALLSEDPARIRRVWEDVTDAEAAAILAHLARMRDEEGWSDGQRAAAVTALQVLHDQAQ